MQLDTSMYGNLKLKSVAENQAEMAQAAHAEQAVKIGKVQLQNQQELVKAHQAATSDRLEKAHRLKLFESDVLAGADDEALLRSHPEHALTFVKGKLENENNKLTQHTKALEVHGKEIEQVGSALSAALSHPTSLPVIAEGMRKQFPHLAPQIDDYLQQYQQAGNTIPPELQQTMQGLVQQAMSVPEQLKQANEAAAAKIAANKARLDAMKAEAELPGVVAEAGGKVKTLAERDANGGLTAAQVATDSRAGATNAELKRHHGATEAIARQDKGTDGLVAAVIANPLIYDNLTPTAKTAIAAKLPADFAGFGKALSEGAIVKLAEGKSAIESLKDLRSTLKDNEQYIGPLAGMQALNPYSDARKAQAKIDLVKQRVGKALEGGVLRKEDEEKYKRILATLSDTPSTAFSKIEGLIESVSRDVEVFKTEQRSAGRRVSGGSPQAPGGTGARPPLSAFEKK